MTEQKQAFTVAFIGLGTMGYPMAGHLAKAGCNLRVYNRTKVKADAWVAEFGGASFDSPAQAANGADVVCICVGNDADVRSVMYGTAGALSALKPGALVIDHTTTSAELAIELAQACLAADAAFMDAPVSGGQAGAQNAKLTAMCGTGLETFEAAQPILQAYCANTQLIGAVGQGQRCKMVNQICIAGVLEGLGDALKLAQVNHLPIDKVVATLSGGAAGSWQLANRLETMSRQEFEFGFALDWMIKDLAICLDEAVQNDISLPLVEQVIAKYRLLSEQGKGRFDTSALCLAQPTCTNEA